MQEPREIIEQAVTLPEGDTERFSGYGVMSAPFASGHLLALRHFSASSVGPGYTSVWRRDPDGQWTFYADVEPLQACTRYFGSAVAKANAGEIVIEWTGPRRFVVTIPPDTLEWEVVLAPTRATRFMNALGRLMPQALWRQPRVLSLMAPVAGRLLGAGRLRLAGRSPNRQWFIANPLLTWTILSSHAVLEGTDLGPLIRMDEQTRLGDFWIPQRGLFAIGATFFESFDATRHLAVASQSQGFGTGAL